MRLVSCYIENFGTLHQQKISFSSEVTMLSRKNGWGKSTLAAFLRVMFYGFDNERSRDPYQNERKRFAPWQGGIYGGTVQFLHGGKEYSLTRTFGSKEKEDQYSLRDVATNLEVKDLASSLGMALFHLDSASFQRTLFVTQNDCKTYATDGIHAKLGNLVEHTHDMNRYEEADHRLNGLLNAMSPTRKTGELYKKKEELACLEMEIKGKEAVEEQYLQLQQEEKQKKYRYQKIKLQQRYGTLLEQYQMRKGEKEQAEGYFKERMFPGEIPAGGFQEDWIPKEEELREQISRYADWRATKKMLDYLAKERGLIEVPEEEERVERRGKSWLALLPIFFGVVFLVKNLLLGAVLILAGLFLFLWRKKKESSEENLPENRGEKKYSEGKNSSALYEETLKKEKRERKQLQCYLESYGFSYGEDMQEVLLDILSHVQRFQGAKKALGEISDAIDRLEEDEEVEDIDDLILPEDSTLEDITAQMETLGRELLQVEKEQESLRKRREMLEEKELLYQEERERYQKRWEQYRMLQKTREHLYEAKVSFTAKYRNPIQTGFAKYLSMLTGEGKEDYLVDTDLNITKKVQGMQRESRFFSAGYQDLTGICMRMALLDAMYPEEKPFLVLDDPFVNLDTHKTEAGLRMMQEIAKEYQVIYFTCHEGRELYVK